ncbi:MAG: RHS repeat-associated core domain-containing protein [Acidobacteriota bacterium]
MKLRSQSLLVVLSVVLAVAPGMSRPQTGGDPGATGESATLLPNGRWLQLGGGSQGLPIARTWHTATLLPNGKVLVLGGLDSQGRVIAKPELLDPESLSVHPLSTPNLTARVSHSATLLSDGRVLVAGGMDARGRALDTLELVDPRTGYASPLPVHLRTGRYHQTAELLADGSVLFRGGVDPTGKPIAGGERYDPRRQTIVPATSRERDPETPFLAASEPGDGASEVPLDSVINLRFSHRVRVQSVNGGTVTLSGPAGPVAARVIPAEEGRLAFLTPQEPLAAGATYTLSLADLLDRQGMPFPAAEITFSTVNPSDRAIPDADQEAAADDSTWRPLPPLQAAPGVTALTGQVLRLNGRPLAGVTLEIGNQKARTDGTGRFLLAPVPAGWHEMTIDARTASRPGEVHGLFEARVEILNQVTTVLPFTIWMPKLDTAHRMALPSPTAQEVVVTTPVIPGLEVHIPPGSVLRDHDGNIATEVSITAIPVDRPPFPLPQGVQVPIYYTIQPGGGYVETATGKRSGVRILYPNYTHEPPGTRIDFWHYDPDERGWYIYGQGTVDPAGRQVVPDPGVTVYELTGAMVSISIVPPDGPPPGGCRGQGGDPVDCSTGLFLIQRTDLSVPGTIPISVTRTYRPRDLLSRSFGIGTNHLYDIFTIGDTFPYTYQDLILPDGGRIHFQRTSPGTGFFDAVYEHTSSPTEFHGAVISYVEGRWRLRMKNGVEMYFPDCGGCTSARAAAMIEYRDRWGNQLTLLRDANRNLTRVASPDGRSIDFTYGTANRITEARDNAGRVVTYQYDASGRLWKVTDPEGGIEEYGYDAAHRMTTVKKPTGAVMVTNVYDANGRVTRQTLADGGIYQFAYTLDGTRVTRTDITDPRGNVRRLTFNAGGFVIDETRALGKPEQQTTTFERAAATNLITAVTDALGRRTAFSYDARGNVTSVTRLAGTPSASTATFTYESSFNQLTSATDALGHVQKLRYDSLGQLTEIEDALGNIARFSYTAAGRVAAATSALGKITQFAYEGGDLLSTTDPLGRIVSMYTDSAGRLLALTDPLGNRYRYDYDRLDRLTKITDPLGAVTSYVYDSNSNLTQITDAKGGVTRFAYDAKDRLTAVTDPLLKTDSFAYDGMDNLTQATERTGKISTFTYDALDRPKTAEFGRATVGAALTPPDATVTYTWDAGNRLTQAVDTQDGTITHGYDTLDRLTSETSPRGSVAYIYDAAGRRTRLSIPGQPDVTYAYDDADRLTGITRGTDSVGFAYDAMGRRTTLSLPGGISTSYTYDDAGQITGIVYTRAGLTLGDLAYQYDAAGRRIRESGSLARRNMPAAVTSATYNAANRLTAWSGTALAYDAKGNLTSDGSRTYTWDSRNRLQSISGAAPTSFGYDAFGRRSSVTVSGSMTRFLYDGANISQELTGTSVKATILGGFGLDEIFRRTDAAGARTFLKDALGSALALVDDAGISRTQYTYTPYGATTSTGDASSNPLQYAGRENDGTGLYYYRARYYSPVFGRFISEDPIGVEGGTNPYAYVGGNPLMLIDPLGLAGCFIDFPDYPITIPYTDWKTTSTPGHAGALGYDNRTGATRYYEYGRFGSDYGSVERRFVSDLTLDQHGNPTPESLDNLLEDLSRKAGHGTTAELTCEKDIDEKKVYDYAERLMHNDKRPPYSWLPWNSNTCRDFARRALGAGRRH